LLDDLVLVRHQRGEVDLHAAEPDAELGAALLVLVVDLGAVLHRLGRDAAPVGAGAAQLVPLDDGHAGAEPRGADRGGVAARPTADHGQIVALALAAGGRAHGPRHPFRPRRIARAVAGPSRAESRGCAVAGSIVRVG